MTTRNVLNHWKIIHAKASEDGQYVACIEGRVASSNPRFPQSSIIRTSYLTAYEIDNNKFVVITARRSEYVLGTRNTAEFLSEDFLKSFLPERKLAPVSAPFDGAGSMVVAYREDGEQNEQSFFTGNQITQLAEDSR
ncbi:hypothetical protein [Dechloromonas sp. HYN0024]|uniref:hypothetical protein n=1 Tax=Dechloromonas sp. HYN0024 TaxID=2231055 RepID=UPI000E446389|nr:hypothetical protein [Dechloromonas sp. HYN0024]AXS81348.1 hypothetical protein HYN24_15695 [Dechloromonas sp. HYN0024]